MHLILQINPPPNHALEPEPTTCVAFRQNIRFTFVIDVIVLLWVFRQIVLNHLSKLNNINPCRIFCFYVMVFGYTYIYEEVSQGKSDKSYIAFLNIKETKIDVKTSSRKINAFVDLRVPKVLLLYIILILFEFWPILSYNFIITKSVISFC